MRTIWRSREAACGWAACQSCASRPAAATSSAPRSTRDCWRTSPASAARGRRCRASCRHSVTRLISPSLRCPGVRHEGCPFSPFNFFSVQPFHCSTVSPLYRFSFNRFFVQLFLRYTVSPFNRFSMRLFLRSKLFLRLTVSPFNRFSVQPFLRSTVSPFNRFSAQPFLCFNRFSVQLFLRLNLFFVQPFHRSTVSPFNRFGSPCRYFCHAEAHNKDASSGTRCTNERLGGNKLITRARQADDFAPIELSASLSLHAK